MFSQMIKSVSAIVKNMFHDVVNFGMGPVLTTLSFIDCINPMSTSIRLRSLLCKNMKISYGSSPINEFVAYTLKAMTFAAGIFMWSMCPWFITQKVLVSVIVISIVQSSILFILSRLCKFDRE